MGNVKLCMAILLSIAAMASAVEVISIDINNYNNDVATTEEAAVPGATEWVVYYGPREVLTWQSPEPSSPAPMLNRCGLEIRADTVIRDRVIRFWGTVFRAAPLRQPSPVLIRTWHFWVWTWVLVTVITRMAASLIYTCTATALDSSLWPM